MAALERPVPPERVENAEPPLCEEEEKLLALLHTTAAVGDPNPGDDPKGGAATDADGIFTSPLTPMAEVFLIGVDLGAD